MNKRKEEFGAACLEARIDQATRERLHHPVVTSLYEAYSDSGILPYLSRLIDMIPKAYEAAKTRRI